jgi:hypothetical protein
MAGQRDTCPCSSLHSTPFDIEPTHVGVNTRRHDCVAAVWLAWRKRHAIFERFGALAEQLAVACTAVEPSCAWMQRPAPEENVACSGAPQSKSCSGYRRRDESWSRARSLEAMALAMLALCAVNESYQNTGTRATITDWYR